jgi:hypothetical protein
MFPKAALSLRSDGDILPLLVCSAHEGTDAWCLAQGTAALGDMASACGEAMLQDHPMRLCLNGMLNGLSYYKVCEDVPDEILRGLR